MNVTYVNLLELNERIKGNIKSVSSKRLQSSGHVERLNETATPKRMLQGKIRQGRERMGWKEEEQRRMEVDRPGDQSSP
jgi:hypothetical protein